MPLKTLSLLALLSLGGCATIQEHPVLTSVGVALVAGSIAASAHHDNRTSVAAPVSQIGAPSCANGACR